MVSQAISIVLSIFIMIALGAWLARIGWLNEAGAALVSQLVVKVALPFMIVNSLFTSFDRATLWAALPTLAAPLISVAIGVWLGRLVGRLTGIPENRRGAFASMFAFSNSVFIGVPVSLALFGDGALPYTLIYYIANTTLFWSVAVRLLARDGGQPAPAGKLADVPRYLAARLKGQAGAADEPQFAAARQALSAVRKALPLPLVTFFACAALILLGVRLPDFALTAARYVGGMVTPLSLFFIGALMMRMLSRGPVRWQKGFSWVLLGRFVVSPLVMLALSRVFPMSAALRDVLIIQASMPVMSSTSIVADSLGADAEYVAGATTLSTMVSLVAIPLYMMILRGL
ncbi:MAG: AEC family transporter [Clostridiales bacterium]|nr:AEC family transporter [Clostridiales bacterium]